MLTPPPTPTTGAAHLVEMLRLSGNVFEARKLCLEFGQVVYGDLLHAVEVAFAKAAELDGPPVSDAPPSQAYPHAVAQWQRLFDHATEGPWHVEALHDDGEPGEVWMVCHNSTMSADTTVVNTFSHADAEAIAASSVAVPALCARVLELEADESPWTEIVPGDPSTKPALPDGEFQESALVLTEMANGERRRAFYVRTFDTEHAIWFAESKPRDQVIYPVRWRPLPPSSVGGQGG